MPKKLNVFSVFNKIWQDLPKRREYISSKSENKNGSCITCLFGKTQYKYNTVNPPLWNLLTMVISK